MMNRLKRVEWDPNGLQEQLFNLCAARGFRVTVKEVLGDPTTFDVDLSLGGVDRMAYRQRFLVQSLETMEACLQAVQAKEAELMLLNDAGARQEYCTCGYDPEQCSVHF